jgi:hypothetical protein
LARPYSLLKKRTALTRMTPISANL